MKTRLRLKGKTVNDAGEIGLNKPEIFKEEAREALLELEWFKGYKQAIIDMFGSLQRLKDSIR